MVRPRAYRAHEALVASARVKPQVWRLILGLGVVLFVSLAMSAIGTRVLAVFFSADWLRDLPTGSTALGLLILLFSFAFVTLGVAVAARILHMRTFRSVLGPKRVFLGQFWRVLWLHLVLMVVLMVMPPYDFGAPMDQNMPVSRWILLLPFSLVAVLVQVSAEEILFRGYLQQSLAARFQSPIVWMGVPAALFAVGHYLPAEAGDNAVLITIWAGMFGLLMADLTARAGSLGPAIAVHLFNNVTAIVIVSSPTSLNGLALFLLPYELSDTGALRPWLAVDFAMMLISWLTARLAIRK